MSLSSVTLNVRFHRHLCAYGQTANSIHWTSMSFHSHLGAYGQTLQILHIEQMWDFTGIYGLMSKLCKFYTLSKYISTSILYINYPSRNLIFKKGKISFYLFTYLLSSGNQTQGLAHARLAHSTELQPQPGKFFLQHRTNHITFTPNPSLADSSAGSSDCSLTAQHQSPETPELVYCSPFVRAVLTAVAFPSPFCLLKPHHSSKPPQFWAL